MKILMIPVGKEPFTKEIENTAEAMEAEIKGRLAHLWFEADGVDSNVNIIYNADADSAAPLNFLAEASGELVPVLGPAFIVGREGPTYRSAPPAQIEALKRVVASARARARGM